MNDIKIIAGSFVLAETGNCTRGYIINDDNVQQRANDAMPKYYYPTGTYYPETNVNGFAIQIGSQKTLHSVHKNEQSAEKEAEEILKRREKYGN